MKYLILCLLAANAYAWEGKVFDVKGKKVTIATLQSAGIGLGARLFILKDGKQTGQGRVTGVFHTKVELALSSGSAQKDYIATDRLTNGIADAQPVAAPKTLDLTKWLSRKIPKASTWGSIAYGNGKFVVLPYGDGEEALVSSDGIRWSLYKLPAPEGNWVLTFGNGIFVAFAGKSSGGSFVGMSITSTDGKTWTYKEVPKLGHNWYKIIYGNGLFLASGMGYSSGGDSQDVFASSTDGNEWHVYERRGDGRHRVIGGNGIFASLNPYISEVGVSADGREWQFSKLETPKPDQLIFGNGIFTISTYSSLALTSLNGIDWAEQPKASGGSLDDIVFYEDKFMGAREGYFEYSLDGLQWENIKLPAQTGGRNKIACGDRRCVIVSYKSDQVLTTK